MSGLILAQQGRLHQRRGGADNFIDSAPPGVLASQSLLRRGLNAPKDHQISDRVDDPNNDEEAGPAIKREEESEEGEYERDEGGDENDERRQGNGDSDPENENEDEGSVDDENEEQWESINEDFWEGPDPDDDLAWMAYGKKEAETRAWAERAAKREVKKERNALRVRNEELAREKETLRAQKETLRAEKEALEAQLAEHARDYKCSLKKSVRQAKARAHRPATAGGVRGGRVMKRAGTVTLTAASSRPRRAGANY